MNRPHSRDTTVFCSLLERRRFGGAGVFRWCLIMMALILGPTSLFAHEGHTHEEMEAVEYSLVTLSYRDAFIAQWLTDDLIDSTPLSDDGAPPGVRPLTPNEMQRLGKANLFFTARDIPRFQGKPPETLEVISIPSSEVPPQKPTIQPVAPAGKKTRKAKQPPQSPEPQNPKTCEAENRWSAPMETIHMAEFLAAELGRRLPTLKEKIDRNLMFLKSELQIVEGKLREIEALSGDVGYLLPPCLYASIETAYALKTLKGPPISIEPMTADRYQRDCLTLGKASCILLTPLNDLEVSLPHSGNFRPPLVVLDAGLKAPAKGNYLTELHGQINAWRSLFPPSP